MESEGKKSGDYQRSIFKCFKTLLFRPELKKQKTNKVTLSHVLFKARTKSMEWGAFCTFPVLYNQNRVFHYLNLYCQCFFFLSLPPF